MARRLAYRPRYPRPSYRVQSLPGSNRSYLHYRWVYRKTAPLLPERPSRQALLALPVTPFVHSTRLLRLLPLS